MVVVVVVVAVVVGVVVVVVFSCWDFLMADAWVQSEIECMLHVFVDMRTCFTRIEV